MVYISSKTGLKSNGYDSAYGASKSGLIRLVESLSEETKESNINVNCIMPSIINTEANRKAVPTANFGNGQNLKIWQILCYSYAQKKQRS